MTMRKTFKKIDIFVRTENGFGYVSSTNWSRSCKEAKERYCLKYNKLPENVKCTFARF